MAEPLTARTAKVSDAVAIAEIYNQGIEDRIATFDIEPRTAESIAAQLRARAPTHPAIVVERSGRVTGFAWAGEYRPRLAYAGVAEFSVYVARQDRDHGVGRLALATLIDAAEARGFTKLVSRIFPENVADRRLDGRCRASPDASRAARAMRAFETFDCVIVERLLGAADD
jgi:L-amino acid N-acyltransferase YncA